MKRTSATLFLIAHCLALALPSAHADSGPRAKARVPAKAQAPRQAAAMRPAVASHAAARSPVRHEVRDGEPEARLIEVYKLIGQADSRQALRKAENLVRDHPNFQLAQLVYGDLLSGQTRPLRTLGDVPDTTAKSAAQQLAELREESQLRLRALRERPPSGAIPSQFLALSPRSRHAIAVDASRSRLYLFENGSDGLKLVADYYISVGKLGIEKNVEGDQRTPLGVYFITSNLDPKSLKDFYGSGALPINYPNQLDLKRGKTGGGIWLHGTPSDQYSRAPLSTDGCVVIANPDLARIIKTVEIRSTPVVIAPSLKWVAPQSLKADSKQFEDALQAWHSAKSSGDVARLTSWYAPDFNTLGKTLTEWQPALQTELKQLGGRGIELKDVSYLRWTDSNDTMVVTFAELVKGAKTGRVKRQYWSRHGSQWKIFFEGTV
ncbi:L,D-transpeptidase family protein [Polaromonas sp.]|uniref:L,D-transpeptidase family protein n=1 Tax=Polaromonas sp. TaxID=1869339 RepID=UPI00286A1075|nr:L,D-transpeptidase family protein [Polaromonas sp.]